MATFSSMNLRMVKVKKIEIRRIEDISEPNRFGLVHPSKAIRMLDRIVIDLTYECTLRCLNCNRFCGLFPRKHEIEIERIRRFVDQSLKMGKKWHHIYIAGGEPSLHPRLEEVFDEVDRYVEFHKKKFGTSLVLKFFTNYHSERAREVADRIPDYIVVSSRKKDSNSFFKPICVAPVDLDFYDDDNLRPCQELYQCGMALNYRGFYPCAEAAAMDDVFLRRNLGIGDLAEVNMENMAGILHQTCRFCGHYFEPLGYRRSTDLMVSPTWKEFLEKQHAI